MFIAKGFSEKNLLRPCLILLFVTVFELSTAATFSNMVEMVTATMLVAYALKALLIYRLVALK